MQRNEKGEKTETFSGDFANFRLINIYVTANVNLITNFNSNLLFSAVKPNGLFFCGFLKKIVPFIMTGRFSFSFCNQEPCTDELCLDCLGMKDEGNLGDKWTKYVDLSHLLPSLIMPEQCTSFSGREPQSSEGCKVREGFEPVSLKSKGHEFIRLTIIGQVLTL